MGQTVQTSLDLQDPRLAQTTVTLKEVAELALGLGPLSSVRVMKWVEEKRRQDNENQIP